MHKLQPMNQRDARSNVFSPYGNARKSPSDNYRPYALRSQTATSKVYATVRSNGKILQHIGIQNFENYNSSYEKGIDNTNFDMNGQDKNCRYKTEMCRNFKERFHCIYGDQCQFAHGREELRDALRHNKYKTKTCEKYWVTGYCAYGPRCNFVHFENDENCDPKSNMARVTKFQNEIFKHPFALIPDEKSPVTSDEELVETIEEVVATGKLIFSELERDKTNSDHKLEELLEKLKRALPPKRSSTPLHDLSKSNGSSADISRISPMELENDKFGDSFSCKCSRPWQLCSSKCSNAGNVQDHGSFEPQQNTYKDCNKRGLELPGYSKLGKPKMDIISFMNACSKEMASPNKMITE